MESHHVSSSCNYCDELIRAYESYKENHMYQGIPTTHSQNCDFCDTLKEAFDFLSKRHQNCSHGNNSDPNFTLPISNDVR